jgi:hypothetical protein
METQTEKAIQNSDDVENVGFKGQAKKYEDECRMVRFHMMMAGSLKGSPLQGTDRCSLTGTTISVKETMYSNAVKYGRRFQLVFSEET